MVSDKKKEQDVDTGLVIIAEDGSEFVWVPVPEDELSLLAEKDGTGNMRGILYNYEQFGNISGTRITYSTSEFREPDVINGDDNAANLKEINDVLSTSLANAQDLKELMQIEYNNIYESIAKYHGFFIGRYETGNLYDNSTKNKSEAPVVSKKNQTTISNESWYYLYAKQRAYAKSLTSAKINSNMIYGSQWEATLRWFAKSSNVDTRTYITDAKVQANYSGSVLATGNTIAVNNIYDMAGNVYDLTAACKSTRVAYGGYFAVGDAFRFAGCKDGQLASGNSANINVGSRLALYI